MLGFSLQKLLFTGLAIAAVIYGFRWFKQMQQREAQRVRQRGNGAKPANSGGSSRSRAPEDDAETMVECTVCGSYVSASNARSCGRENCPYPG